MIDWSMIYKILLNWQLRVTLWTTEVTEFKNWMGIPGIVLFNNWQRFHFCQFDVNSSYQVWYFSVFCCFYGIHSNQTLWTFCNNFHSFGIAWYQIIFYSNKFSNNGVIFHEGFIVSLFGAADLTLIFVDHRDDK